MQQLPRLNKFSPDFHDQLSNVLSSEEYEQSVPNLQGNDLVSLVDYLDKVCHPICFPALCSSQRRLSVLLTPQALVSVNVYPNSGKYVVPERYSRPRTPLCLHI